MKCPACNVDLTMSDRQGVEIDYYPKCRGVWLGRGELDKIIERVERAAPATNPRYGDERLRYGYNRCYDDDDDDDDYGYGGRRRRGFLGGLFDYD